MGRQKLRLKRVIYKDFSKGYFPNQDFETVPEGGSSDCKHVIWHQSALRKMFGMDRINSSATSEARGSGLFYLDVSGTTKRTAVFGTKFWEDVSGTWTDRTGAVTITDGDDNLVQAINHQQGANKYAIYVNGVDAPWKWTGSGDAAVLSGSPPANFSSIAKYHDTIFGSDAESVYFSDTGDPETWDSTRWVINFDKNVKCMLDNGQKLAVLMEDHIGSIQGYDDIDFTVEENEIKNVGCVGRLAACKAYFGQNQQDVIVTVSRDGVYIIDQAFGVQKLFGDDYFSAFNQANLHKACVAYSGIDKHLYVALPLGAATENDYLVVVDMLTGAFWPCPSIHTNSVRVLASMRDESMDEYMYFVDTAGYAFKFNRATYNYHTGSATQAIDARFKTRRYDFEDVYQLREAFALAAASGDWTFTMAVGFGLTSDDGDSGTINLLDEGDLLGTTFILGASTLGGSTYVFKPLSGVGNFGRFMSLVISNSTVDEYFSIKRLEVQLRRRRMGSDDK